MAGIFGIVEKNSEKSASFTLNKVTSMVKHFPWLKVHSISNNEFKGFLVLPDCLSVKDYLYEDDDLIMLLYGNISRKHLKNTKLDVFINNLSELASLYKTKGVESLVHMDGSYTLCIWDKKKHCLYIANDWLGSRKLYYWQSTTGIVFGSEYKICLLHPDFKPKLDKFSLVQFLRRNYLIQDNNMYENMKLIPSDSLLKYFQGKQEIKVFNWAKFTDDRYNCDMADLIEEYYQIISNTVSDCLIGAKKVLVPLSGGLDSRLLLIIANNIKSKSDFALTAINHGRKSSAESKAADLVAKKVKVPFIQVTLKDNFLSDYIEEQNWISELAVDSHATHWFPTLYKVKSEYDCILSGYIGDVFAGSYLNLSEGIDKNNLPMSEKAKIVLQRYTGRMPMETCSKLLKRDFVELLNEEEKSSRCYLENTYGNTIKEKWTLYLLNTQMRRFISYILDYNSNLGEAVAPYISHSNVNFFFSLSPAILHNRLFFKEFMRSKFKGFSEVMTTADPMPIVKPSSFDTHYIYIKQMLFYYLFCILKKQIPGERTYNLVYYPDIIKFNKKYVYNSIFNNPLFPEIFNMDMMQKHWDEFLFENDSLYWQWFELLAFDKWSRKFLTNYDGI